MAISIDWGTRIITVPKADTALVQSVPSEIRSLDLNTFRLALKQLEESEAGINSPTTHNHNTTLSVGGVTLARVIEIINGYTITFEDGQWAVNLVGANSNVGDNVNVNQVSVRSANSAGLIQQTELDSLKFQVESLRTSHQGFGKSFYVATNGLDTNSGTSSASPKRTIAEGLALCETGRGDIVYLLDPGINGVFAENIVITKNDVHLRAPGRGLTIQPTSGVPVTLSADNCSLTGLYIKTAANATTEDGIVVNGKFAKLDSLYVVGPDTGGVNPVGSGNGIHFRGGDYHKVFNCVVEKFGGDGVMFDDAGLSSGSPREAVFYNNQIYFNRQHGVHLVGTSSNSTRMNVFENNQIVHNSEYGIYMGAQTQRNIVHADNYIKDNGTYPSGAGGTELFLGGFDNMVDNMSDTMPAAIRAELAPELSKMSSQINGLTPAQLTMLTELYNLMGLSMTEPLIVTETTRTAGTISQTISSNAGGTTVTRI